MRCKRMELISPRNKKALPTFNTPFQSPQITKPHEYSKKKIPPITIIMKAQFGSTFPRPLPFHNGSTIFLLSLRDCKCKKDKYIPFLVSVSEKANAKYA